MNNASNINRVIGFLASSVLLMSASCTTHEKLTHPAIPIAVQPFQEIPIDFIHHWDDKGHPFSGAAVIDVDQDGSMELFVGGGGGQDDALFRYLDGKLINIIQGSGLSSPTATYGATSIDMDHDGDTDLLIARDDGISLYLNNHGRFTRHQIPLTLEPDAVPFTIAVSDINHDGHGDLYVSVFVSKNAFRSATFNDPTHAKHNVMLLNNGDLTFTDISQSSGTASKQNTFLSAFVDLDGDGWQDLVVAQNTGEIEIFKNGRNATFTPIATNSGYGFWMGLAVGDVDKDGDQDLFFTNVGTSISHYFLKGDIKDGQRLESQWLLLRNDGDFAFTDVTEAYGLRDYGFAWGTVFEDLNLDGYLDILAAQNYIKWPVHKIWKLPGKSFLQVPSSPLNTFVHVDDLGLTNPYFGQTPVIADLNGDTKPDVIWLNMNGPLRAFLNRSTANGIGIALPDTVLSLGTQVTIETTSGRSYTKQFVTSVGMLSDQSPTLFFGLGGEREVTKVHIQHPDGSVSVIEHPSINQPLIVQEYQGNGNALRAEQEGRVSRTLSGYTHHNNQQRRNIMTLTPSFKHRTVIAMTAMALALAAPAFADELPATVMGKASEGLVTLATTGNPDPLQAELGGTVMSSEDLQKKVGNLLNLEKEEHLAPKALVTPTGETYAMVAPTITKDNFILVDSQGQARRMDVGDSEGHRMPFVVQTIVEDGGTPWYVEFWHWITG